MEDVLITVHLILAVTLVALILLQKSDGGALGLGGRSDGLVSARGAADFLSTTTTYLAAAFFATSLGLAWVAKQQSTDSEVFQRAVQSEAPSAPAPILAPIAPLAPIDDKDPTTLSLDNLGVPLPNDGS